MTDTTSLHAPSVPTLADPRANFAKAVAIGRQVIEGIRPDQFDNPTPCREYDVRQLAGHVLAVLNRIAVVGATGDFSSTPRTIDDVADTALVPAYQEFADRIEGAWSDDAVLAKLMTLPWGQLPGAITMMIYINEVSVHTWDLATATAQQPNWDDDVLQMAYAAITRGLPAQGRQGDGTDPELVAPFDKVVPVADDAPLIDRLVAWNGRKP